jgi:hypothetical protein
MISSATRKNACDHSICFDLPAKNGCMTTMYDSRLPLVDYDYDYDYRKREPFDWDKELVSCCRGNAWSVPVAYVL